jgi:hypothetical protein
MKRSAQQPSEFDFRGEEKKVSGEKGVRTLFSGLAEEESAPSSSFTAHSGTAIRTPEGELALRGTRGYSIDHHARHGPEPPQKRVLTPFPRLSCSRYEAVMVYNVSYFKLLARLTEKMAFSSS